MFTANLPSAGLRQIQVPLPVASAHWSCGPSHDRWIVSTTMHPRWETSPVIRS